MNILYIVINIFVITGFGFLVIIILKKYGDRLLKFSNKILESIFSIFLKRPNGGRRGGGNDNQHLYENIINNYETLPNVRTIHGANLHPRNNSYGSSSSNNGTNSPKNNDPSSIKPLVTIYNITEKPAPEPSKRKVFFIILTNSNIKNKEELLFNKIKKHYQDLDFQLLTQDLFNQPILDDSNDNTYIFLTEFSDGRNIAYEELFQQLRFKNGRKDSLRIGVLVFQGIYNNIDDLNAYCGKSSLIEYPHYRIEQLNPESLRKLLY